MSRRRTDPHIWNPYGLLRPSIAGPRCPPAVAERLLADAPAEFFAAVAYGLSWRLKRDGAWLRGQFGVLSLHYRLLEDYKGPLAACQYVLSQVATAKRPPKNARTCDALRVEYHYELAWQHFQGLAGRSFRLTVNLADTVRQGLPDLFKQLTTGIARCHCACDITTPADLAQQLDRARVLSKKGKARPAELAVWLLAHHHGQSPNTIRRLLTEGRTRAGTVQDVDQEPGEGDAA